MSLNRVGEKALQALQANTEIHSRIVSTKFKNVLDEDHYIEDMEKIIKRDFFPDLEKLEAQKEYLDAFANNDTEKMRALLVKYGPKRIRPGTSQSAGFSPATFETPDINFERKSPEWSSTSQEKGEVEVEETKKACHAEKPTEHDEAEERRKCSLDQYLARNTSEDNASFEEILNLNEAKLKEKHAWLYEQEIEKNQAQESLLVLPGIEKQAIMQTAQGCIQSWSYKARNSLMYNPDGCEKTLDEIIQKKKKPRIIEKKNTRFVRNPFNLEKSQQTIAEAATVQALALHGKIGVDGKEIIPEFTPKVNGHGFVSTPSPAPGVDESPLMTWGEIEGTPFRLDGSDTPLSHTDGPVFKIPKIPRRDEIALELAEKASKSHRAKKEDALRRVSKTFATSSPQFGSSPIDRLSPAARRLASTGLGVRTHTDKALRASYTPSPKRSEQGDKSPLILSTPSPAKSSRRSARRTPKASPKRNAADTPDMNTLTDNLLQLPVKRSRATDFF